MSKPILGTDRLLSAEEAVKLMQERGYGQETTSRQGQISLVLLNLAKENKIRVWLWHDGQLKFQHDSSKDLR